MKRECNLKIEARHIGNRSLLCGFFHFHKQRKLLDVLEVNKKLRKLTLNSTFPLTFSASKESQHVL
jgi:hypothetical protein